MMNTADGTAIQFIESAADFIALQKQFSASRHIGLDTEFMRTNTFYPLLGLIQLADEQGCYLIDPLPLTDRRDLTQFLNSHAHILVFHSCSEDLNLLFTSLNAIPAQVFDTQIAAAFLGLGFSLSYQALVHILLGLDIPKDETRSDWLKRPLSDTQKIYAATDVCHLLELRDLLENRLQERGVHQWFEQECQQLLSVAQQSEAAGSWETIYANINNAWKLSDTGLRYLQQLCVWREQEARRRNKPRSWIAKDGDLLNISIAMSREKLPNLQGLLAVAGADKSLLNRYASTIVELLSSSDISSTEINRQILNNPLSASSRNKLRECQRVVQAIANEYAIAPALIGRKKIILELVRGFEQDPKAGWPSGVGGWRRTLLEPVLTPILCG